MNQPLKLLTLTLMMMVILGAGALSSEKTIQVTLDWISPQSSEAGESQFLPALYFQGATYSDSMPRVPVKTERIATGVPGYDYTFTMIENELLPCTPVEVAILEASGFTASEFTTFTDQETSRGETFSRFHIVPVRKRNGVYEKLVSFSLQYQLHYQPELKSGKISSFPESSVLASGEWFRICVEKDGIYRIDRQDLVSLGMNPSQVVKSTIQIFGNGGGMLPEANNKAMLTDPRENAIWVSGDGSAAFANDDYILFYGQSPGRWTYNQSTSLFEHQVHLYSQETCYFLTYGQSQGLRVEAENNNQLTANETVTDFLDYAHYQRDQSNLIGSGKTWFGELFDLTLSRTYDFSFPNINTQKQAGIAVFSAARSASVSSFTIDAAGASARFNISQVSVNSVTSSFASVNTGRLSVNPQGNNLAVKLTYNRTSSGGRGWLGFITVNAYRHLVKTDNQMFFRNPDVVGPDNISRFQLSGLNGNNVVWDVTDPFNIRQLQLQLNGNAASFISPTPILKEYVVFNDQQMPKPRLGGKVANQNLHAHQVKDLVIVVPEIFRQEAERLATFRREFDGLSVQVVSPQEIYNEFSSGVTDISAIRNYMRMFYERASETGKYPRYLLLFGNGTYDNRNLLGFGGNLIPTFQTLQSLNPGTSFITDDFFGLLDPNEGHDGQGAIDLGIGRLPVRTVDEARFVVNKIIRYNQRIEGLVPGTDDPRFAGVIPNYADWRNVISFIADDEDSNTHLTQTESLTRYVSSNHPVYNIEKIYLDAYEQVTLAGGSRYPDVNKAIHNRVNQGALLINYVGHGGILGLAHERILTFDDILSWGNYYNLPVFMTATCEFSSFDQPDPNELSAGVRIFLKPDGGAAALFTTTRLAYSYSNFTLNDAFVRNAFVPMADGQMPRLGDLIRISKVQSSSATTLKNFVLLGDPSMQLAYPKLKAVTTSVPDTIRALEEVTIKGEIHNAQGAFQSQYNGIIYPVVYDKIATLQTRGNDPGSQVVSFDLRDRIIYRGKASVTDGKFEFVFMVPRDINYSTGTGKISYYFDDGMQEDGCGVFENFTISGTSGDYIADNQGPEITLYLNNLNFTPGDKTGPNPVLLAYISDSSGINTTGQIGHDIVAFLNNNTTNPFILNNFYQTEVNSYTSGRVVYPFFNLEKGEYTLTLRAWDAHNNVNTASIDFLVTSAPGLELTTLMNIPNPFNDKTRFSIEHNKPASEMNILIQIYSLTGQVVKSIEQKIYASGFNVPPIEWDGRDDSGMMLNNGIYLFRALVSTTDGDQVQKTEKLMILR